MKKIALSALILAVVASIFTLYRYVPRTDITEPMTLKQRCDFIMKSNAKDFSFAEPKAGVYKYELYATPDGYIEVWKCPNN